MFPLVPAVCKNQPPGQIPVVGKRCGVCPGSAQGTGLGQGHPHPCSGSCLVLRGSSPRAEHQLRCRPSPASSEPGPACLGTEELHLRGLTLLCSGHALCRKARRRRRRRQTADEQNDRLQSLQIFRGILSITCNKGAIALLGRTESGSVLYYKEDAKQAAIPLIPVPGIFSF